MSVYFVRTTSVTVCTHTSIYIYIGLASSNMSRRIRLEPVQTHNLFLFQSNVGVWMSREKNGQSKWESITNANGTLFFMQYVIIVVVASSILSRNDSRLIKLVQCVNLIHRFPSYSISFYAHTHFIHCASISSCVCFITSTASIDLLNLARKEKESDWIDLSMTHDKCPLE
jgi:hypothetical protein